MVMKQKVQSGNMMTVDEVVDLFDKHFLTRDKRSVQRYAAAEKFVDAFFEPDERRWYIPEESALRFIEHVKEINARHKVTSRDVSRQDRKVETPPDIVKLHDENRDLRNRIRHLEVDVRVKEALVNQVDERNAQLQRDSLVIAEAKGRLEAENNFLKRQLEQIDAPRQRMHSQSDEVSSRPSTGSTQSEFGDGLASRDNVSASSGKQIVASQQEVDNISNGEVREQR